MRKVRPPSARSLYLLAFLSATVAQAVLAQPRNYEGRNIAVIQFIPFQQPLEASQLHDMLPLKPSTPLRMADVRTAIERLYATGRYEDIQVDAELRGEDVIVRFYTKNSWFIGHVGMSGDVSSPPNRGQLVNATRLELGQPFTEDMVEEARAGAERLLQSNGLYQGRVEPLREYDPATQQVHLRFHVKSGDRARFTRPVVQGDLKLSTDRIIAATGWRRWLIGTWRPVTQARVRQGLEGIRSLYGKEDRLEARVAMESMPWDADSNRARPVVNIEAGPKIEVNVVGADISKKDLKRYVPVYEERTVDHDLLEEGARNLRDHLQSQGYFDAEVVFKQQRVTNDKAVIDYLINPGRRHKLVHIEIIGNRYFTTDTLRERMFLQEASLLQFRYGRYSESLLRRDQESIANLYRSNGFRDVVVTSRIEDDYQGQTGDIAVFLQVTEGSQWLVGSLEVQGIRSLDEQAVRQMLSSAEGQPFSEFNVAVDRDTILEQYFTRGFPEATFEWSSTPAAGPNTINLKFVVREGEQRFVRQVLVSGLGTTSPGLVNRNIVLNPGDPLSPTQMRETQRRLYDLGVFARVETAIQNPEGESERKYVLYDMEEARRYSVAVGFGAEVARIGGSQTSLTGAAGQSGFAPRISLDVSRLNLWGLGHGVSFRSRASTLQRRALLNYSAPRYRNREGLNLSFTSLYDDSRDVRTFSSRRLEGSAQLSQRWSKATTLFYRYTYRRVSVDVNTLKIAPLLIPLLAQPVRLGMIGGNMIQDRRDDPAEPHKGIYNTLDLGLAERIFGSQRNFFRFLGRNSTYYELTRRLVLARSTSVGVLHPFRFALDPLQAIPLPERFFAGGGSSHRGFPENQAGPRDLVTGFPLGGTAQLFNQTELRFPLIGENIGGVLFHDAGNIYSGPSKISFRVTQRDVTDPETGRVYKDFDYMVHAVGLGIRYRTPIGPVRVDLAYSINPPRFFGFQGTREELLNAGVNPCQSAPDKCREQSISHFQFFFSIGQTF